MRGRLAIFCALALAAMPAAAAPPRWIAAWASSQQVPEPHNALAPADYTDTTIRQVVRVSIAGKRFRVRLSNAFGTAPLTIDAAHVARARGPGSAAIDPASDRALSFGGSADVRIPAGADYWSDPVDLPLGASAPVAISLHFAAAPEVQTSHPGSRTTSYIVAGDHTGDAALPEARTVDHWYQLSGIEVEASPRAATIVALGDSITDGAASTTNGDDRWTDALIARLRAERRTANVALVNVGTGGNRLLLDGLGPNALARLDRDVIAQAGAKYLILLEGVNDLGTLTRDQPASAEQHAALVREIIGAYRQIVARARAHGIKAIGATILPYGGSPYYHPDAASEADRAAVNAWIRTPGNFDAVIDFDRAIRDPEQPDRMLPDYDSGDHLHPSPAGYRAMAAAVPLGLFVD